MRRQPAPATTGDRAYLRTRVLAPVDVDAGILLPMLLVVDVGNTQTHIGTFRDGALQEHWRVFSESYSNVGWNKGGPVH